MHGWVTGPVLLNERTLDVYEGTEALILRNGQAFAVRGPGRNGGLLRTLSDGRNLPITGRLEVLTFEQAPTASDPISTSVRLRDGATVIVTVQTSIIARWEKDRQSLMGVVRRYGINPRRIEEAAALELIHAVKAMVNASLSGKTHNQVHDCADYRELLRVPSVPGLLLVGDILSCEISRDQHAEASLTAVREAEVEHLRAQMQTQLDAMRANSENRIESIRRNGRLEGHREEATSAAEVNSVVAKMLGVQITDVAFPEQRQARLGSQYEAIASVLRDNLDLLPLFADPSISGATQELTALVNGLFNPGGVVAAEPMRQRTSSTRQSVPERTRLLGRASMASPAGALEILLLESGPDQLIGQLGRPGPHRLLVRDEPDPVQVAARALGLAATWCGVKVRANMAGPGVLMTRVEADGASLNQDVMTALGIWIAAINKVLGGRTKVTVQQQDPFILR